FCKKKNSLDRKWTLLSGLERSCLSISLKSGTLFITNRRLSLISFALIIFFLLSALTLNSIPFLYFTDDESCFRGDGGDSRFSTEIEGVATKIESGKVIDGVGSYVYFGSVLVQVQRDLLSKEFEILSLKVMQFIVVYVPRANPVSRFPSRWDACIRSILIGTHHVGAIITRIDGLKCTTSKAVRAAGVIVSSAADGSAVPVSGQHLRLVVTKTLGPTGNPVGKSSESLRHTGLDIPNLNLQ
ncbi:hypothetical protein SDJN02_14562, partial [Cucurbita argyrosperma subsp. argyrosperma]